MPVTSNDDASADAHRALLRQVAADPRYRELVRRRSRFAWLLTILMLLVFFGYILLIAFDKELLGLRIAGDATTLGIPLGLGVIVAGILLTGVYVRKANKTFDPMLRSILADLDR
jgi:uncharacterized membrane protein (DUF485 family)